MEKKLTTQDPLFCDLSSNLFFFLAELYILRSIKWSTIRLYLSVALNDANVVLARYVFLSSEWRLLRDERKES